MSNLMMMLRRRWAFALAGLMLTAGLAVAGYVIAKPTYQATASILLLPPASTVDADGNPFLQLGGLDLTVDLLGKALTDQDVTRKIEELSGSAETEVGSDPSSSAPILRVQVQDKSAAEALEVRDVLVDMAPARLADFQSAVGVDGRNRVTSSVIVIDAEAEPVGRDKLVGAVVGGIAGLGLTLIFIAMIDSALLRRKARRTAASNEKYAKEAEDGRTGSAHASPRRSRPGRDNSGEPDTDIAGAGAMDAPSTDVVAERA